MKKLALSAVFVVTLTVAFTAASALAQSCPNGGCGGGKKKDTSTNSPATNSTAIVRVAL
jgi:hypothetical protein